MVEIITPKPCNPIVFALLSTWSGGLVNMFKYSFGQSPPLELYKLLYMQLKQYFLLLLMHMQSDVHD